MTVQVLVAAMNQTDSSLIDKMNIRTDAIIGNQCDRNEVEQFNYKGHNIKIYSFNERGVGLNRNNILMRATADVCIFADEDMEFVDNYEKIVREAFKKIKDADGIIFNIETIGNDVKRRINSKIKRISWYNSFNYGTARLSVRNSKIIKNNIMFNRQFGGGCKYSFGEDTLFIQEMLKKRMKLYVYPVCIAKVKQDTSTWFKGYNDKYFKDKGALFYAISDKMYLLYILQDIIRHKKMYGKRKYMELYSLMISGAKEYKK